MIYTNFSLTKHLVVKTMNKTANQTWCWTSESWNNRNTHTIFTASLFATSNKSYFRISALNCNNTCRCVFVLILNEIQLFTFQVFLTLSHLFYSFISSNSTENNNAWITENMMRIYNDYICIYELVLKNACA
jgi:hypothetical protein